MRRENRRVAAMSWGAGDDMPPPKPSRVPHAGNYIWPFATNFVRKMSFVFQTLHPYFPSELLNKERRRPI